MYRNQTQVGAAIATAIAAGVCTREQLFITSKLMTYDLAPEAWLNGPARGLHSSHPFQLNLSCVPPETSHLTPRLEPRLELRLEPRLKPHMKPPLKDTPNSSSVKLKLRNAGAVVRVR